MSHCFLGPNSLGGRVKVKLDLSNYATITDLKNASGFDTSNFAKTVDLANLKSYVHKLDSDNPKYVPTNLNNLKGKVDKLDVVELVRVPVDLCELSDVVKNDVCKANLKNVEDKIPDIAH